MKNHGGTIAVESAPGKGARFHVYFPVLEKDDGLKEEAGMAPVRAGNERILLIDDEPTITGLFKEMLERVGYKVTTRTSSLEALEIFRKRPRDFDMVITDMTMPRMTGDRLARELLEINPAMPIILCTGFSEQISEEKARAMGIRAFVMKPLTFEALSDAVRSVLDEADPPDRPSPDAGSTKGDAGTAKKPD